MITTIMIPDWLCTCDFLLLLKLLLQLLFFLHSFFCCLLLRPLLFLLLPDPLLQGGDVWQFLWLLIALCYLLQVEKHFHAVERSLSFGWLDGAWFGISSTRNTGGKWTCVSLESMHDNSICSCAVCLYAAVPRSGARTLGVWWTLLLLPLTPVGVVETIPIVSTMHGPSCRHTKIIYVPGRSSSTLHSMLLILATPAMEKRIRQ